MICKTCKGQGYYPDHNCGCTDTKCVQPCPIPVECCTCKGIGIISEKI